MVTGGFIHQPSINHSIPAYAYYLEASKGILMILVIERLWYVTWDKRGIGGDKCLLT